MMSYAQLEARVKTLEAALSELIPAMQALQKELAEKDAELKAMEEAHKAEVAQLKGTIATLQRMVFGQRSEKTKYVLQCEEQLGFFEPLPEPEAVAETVKIPEHTRKKSKKDINEMLDLLPNKDVILDVPEEERVDANGEPLEYLGKELVRRTICSEPARLWVENTYIKTYGSKRDPVDQMRKTIVKPEVPPAFYPHSFLSPSLIAEILVNKYCYSIPLYRQERMYAERGLEIKRNTMANWVIFTADTYLAPLVNAMHEFLVQQGVIHADETALQVLKEPNKKATSQSRLWVYTTSVGNRLQICCYDYCDSRKGECTANYLRGFTGVLVTDGCPSYNTLTDVTHAGCWAHTRRKWFDAIPKDLKVSQNKDGWLKEDAVAQISERDQDTLASIKGFRYCNKLFEIERELKDLTPDERKEQRQLRSKPVLDEYWAFVDSVAERNPQGNLKKALTYTVNQKTPLCAFLENGEIEISNNAAERSVRNAVIGRKNWLFCDTPDGAKATAYAYSVMATAKINNLCVYDYLVHILTVLWKTPQDEVESVLPGLMPWTPEMQAAFRLE